ncbi:MAG: hypothetical protein ABJH82_12485 [Polaribacter sp.]|uniref:hypothetical protein n=1 Tax=Polaribacter sp. TaxID=1920175 RepID=UPI003267F322
MKKQILNLGKALNKAEQKEVFGGSPKPINFDCLVNFGDPSCCTSNECGNTGGIWQPNAFGYGTSENCACF